MVVCLNLIKYNSNKFQHFEILQQLSIKCAKRFSFETKATIICKRAIKIYSIIC